MNKLTEADFEWAARELGVELAAIKAVDAVESRGSGFYFDGRPTILFERHVFRRETNGKYDLVAPDISGPAGGYGSASGNHQHSKLNKAAKLDRKAALRSASWGRFQIMGFNHELVGFKDVESFVAAMESGERAQLEAFVKFLQATNLVRHLRSKSWAAFAKGYNGPGYARNQYDTRLAEAYRKFS